MHVNIGIITTRHFLSTRHDFAVLFIINNNIKYFNLVLKFLSTGENVAKGNNFSMSLIAPENTLRNLAINHNPTLPYD
jgi:hypothetical protein